MSDHHTDEQPTEERELEAPDPPGNPAEHTAPRRNPEVDPARVEIQREDAERTLPG